MGSTALSALEALAARFEVVAIVRPPSPSDEVVKRASELGIPVAADASLENVGRLVREVQPDCLVVSSYGRILGDDVLRLSRW
jgi:methionyl-tRNA formyltransferase